MTQQNTIFDKYHPFVELNIANYDIDTKEITNQILINELAQTGSINLNHLNIISKAIAITKGFDCYWYYYRKSKNNQKTHYKWNSENDACQKCKELDGQIFDYEPQRPHPNCNCEIEEIPQEQAIRIYKEHREEIGKRDENINNGTNNVKDLNNSKLNDKGERVYYDPQSGEYKKLGECAMYVGNIVEKSFSKYKRAKKAKDCGQNLETIGFYKVQEDKNYETRKGDIKIYQPYDAFEKDSVHYSASNSAGHMQLFNGEQWVSDFKQGETGRSIKNKDNGMYPNQGYENSNTPSQIYRHAKWQDWKVEGF